MRATCWWWFRVGTAAHPWVRIVSSASPRWRVTCWIVTDTSVHPHVVLDPFSVLPVPPRRSSTTCRPTVVAFGCALASRDPTPRRWWWRWCATSRCSFTHVSIRACGVGGEAVPKRRRTREEEGSRRDGGRLLERREAGRRVRGGSTAGGKRGGEVGMGRRHGQKRETSGEPTVRQRVRACVGVRQTVPIRHPPRRGHVVDAATQRAGVHTRRRCDGNRTRQTRQGRKSTPHDVPVRECTRKPGKPAAGARTRRVHQRKHAVRCRLRREGYRIRRLWHVRRHARAMERRQRAPGTAQTARPTPVRAIRVDCARRTAGRHHGRRCQGTRRRRVGKGCADRA
mmetsp:Transcript_10589/g.65175  ORF Transcript_10589/g.65175 Transcript_10589/m.65175 type:complete len:340 (+) Transcript_10589:1144-2163(+)